MPCINRPRRWNLDEVRNGDAFRYHFRTDLATKPVLEPWNMTGFRYELRNKTQPEDGSDLAGSKDALGGQVEQDSSYTESEKSSDIVQNRNWAHDVDPGIRRVQLVEALVLKEEYRSLYHGAGEGG